MPTLQIEAQHKGIVGGVDEVGRGPWAGPVVAGVAVFCSPLPSFLSDTIQDSKKLSKSKRDSIYKNLLNLEDFYYGVGVASVEEIDQLNILRATFLAMERAVQSLPEKPHVLLIDGKFIPSFEGIETYPVIKGDSLSLSIAAASILAKVTRDKMMEALAEEYPHYGWERNAGYGTAEHHHALKIHGITPHHRRSFAPIRNLCN
ncbi:MAG: ribonuclease HII [Alphaproteobacteria bacterium]|nr:ribonuclease HII [Alphaproteobacteria bacterium]MBP7729431.1 ribonuclease HII [Alphaproteobacteria bacterium]